MSSNATGHSLASLILRLTLAVIFIYHGLGKIIGSDKVWGANWAATLWDAEARPPQNVLDRLGDIPGYTTEELQTSQDLLYRAYVQEQQAFPATLQYAAVQIAVAWGELLGGIALLLGLLTRGAAVGLLIIQAGAIWTLTGGRGFSVLQGGGYEYNVALLGMCLALVFLGGGKLAVDACLFKRSGQAQPTPSA